MTDDLDAQFLHRISLTEAELLNLDPTLLDDFNRRWLVLVEDLKVAMDADGLRVSTIRIAHALANRVSKVVQTLLDLEVLAEKLKASLLDETSTILDTPVTLPELPHPANVAPYIKPSYTWLLENLHNPYPSTRVRDDIAQKSGAARKDVDNWFIDARKRIGWNALRKAVFSNKRVDIVDAATRFFVEDDPKRPLDPTIEYEFIAIKKSAKDLYVDKFSESDLAARLDMAVKNLTPQRKAEAMAERLRQLQLRKDRESYPSPDRSPEPTRLSPVPYNDDADTNAPRSISATSRKRRSSSAEPPSDESEPSADRPTKRSRLEDSSSSPKGLAFPTGLPSPAASVDEPLQAPGAADPVAPLVPSTISATPNRKRRLSDSDGQGAPKRPRNLPVGPRLQAVSDPLPLSSALFDASAFDGWFQKNFDLQSPPQVGEISPCGFDVELGNLSDFECESQTESASGSPRAAQQAFELPTVEVDSAQLQVPNSDLPSEFNLDDLQSFLSSNPLTNFPQHVAPLGQDFPMPQIPSLGLDFLNDFEASFQTPNETTSAVNDSFTASAAPAFDFHWALPDYLNVGAHNSASHPGKGPDPPHNGLDLLPSLSMPNSAEFSIPLDGDYLASLQAQAARKQKEMKLKQMKEEALRLELELAASA
ncbi:hypothetical protein LshimejAT787_0301950 [Lyophyllum shimeji]|uniref:Homeobox domain-containing protein n=1 Tax=Lyophyllum shimeji TaxID=47721 RepID=A0A9P3UJZ6_LYOSH|nr:hypothetical protein LshimejAT787_0301950 [Lyophyllum shimeji]